jgi:molecular chaperone GrpE (heat shock protein)
MRNKIFLFAAVLSLVGAAALAWSILDQRKQDRLFNEQREKIKANMHKVDEILSGRTDINSFGGIVSTDQLQQELDKYKGKEESRELIFTASVVCVSSGGLIVAGWSILRLARLLIKTFSKLNRLTAKFLKKPKQDKDQITIPKYQPKKKEDVPVQEDKPIEPQTQPKKYDKALVKSGWRRFDSPPETLLPQSHKKGNSKNTPADDEQAVADNPYLARTSFKHNAQPLQEKTSTAVAVEEPPESKTENTEQKQAATALLEKDTKTEPKDSCAALEQAPSKVRPQGKTMTKHPENKLPHPGPKTQTAVQTSPDHTEPLHSAIKELSQEVAAIRHYASQQQDRVVKLESGYDYNIVKNFCLRVIRCIDNLENRISQLADGDTETACLEDTRDELLFALESSGIERFEPEIESDYQGQEKYAEAVKDRLPADDPKLNNKVAEVLRAGYQYVIDEENVKIVRTAQVKLFGSSA